MKRRLFTLVMVIALLFTMIPSVFADYSFGVTYIDVTYDDWYGDNVYLVSNLGYMHGTGDGKFSPDAELTRAMFLTVLGRIEGISQNYYDTLDAGFKDVDAGQWYSAYVAWGVEKGITEGVGGGKFAPNEPITREQMATLVYRYIQVYDISLSSTDAAVSGFKDEDDISDFAVEAVELMRNTGIIVGDDKGCFNPGDYATRAEAATVFSRLIMALPEDSFIATEDKDYQINYANAHVFKDSFGEIVCYCAAEIENIGDTVLSLSSANFDFKDESGEIFAAAGIYGGSPSTIEPGEVAYFQGETYFDEAIDDADLSICVTAEVVKEPFPGTKVTLPDITLTVEDGMASATGKFTNPLDETAYTNIDVILYDEAGYVITILHASEGDIPAGQSVDFDCGYWLPTDITGEDIADCEAIAIVFPG